MEDFIWIVIALIWMAWKLLSKPRKAIKPIGPPPPPRREDEVEFEEPPYDRLKELAPRYFEETPLEIPPALYVQPVKAEPAAPEPAVHEPARVVPPAEPPPGLRRRARRRIPDLKEAVAWAEILAPPVGLRPDEAREV